MGEEQKKILEMVAEGKITADDGAKLLEALKAGREKRMEMESPAARARHMRKKILRHLPNGNIPDMPDMGDIGRMVSTALSESLSGIGNMNFFGGGDIDLEDSELLEGELEIPEGSRIIVKRSAQGRGDVSLIGVTGDRLSTQSHDQAEVRVFRGDEFILLKWKSGDLLLNVPESAETVTVKLTGGDIRCQGLLSEAVLKTTGGDIGIQDVSRGFRAKTLGGNVMIGLAEGWSDDSAASTMGGNMILYLPEGIEADVTASTYGGEISVQGGIGEITESGQKGRSSVNIIVGEDEADRPELVMKTMGGNVSISGNEEE